MTISCPFCNHEFASSAGSMCPRCGEMLPGRTAASATPTAIDLGTVLKSRLKQAAVVLVIIFAAIAAAVVWKLMEERKKNAIPFVPPPPATNAVTPPLELRGLQYLPPNANIVFAVQPGPLVVHAESKKQNPADALSKIKFVPTILAALANAGLTLSDIDHVAAGIYIPDRDEELRVGLVLVLRQMRDETKFLDGLKAKPAAGGYEVMFDKYPVRMKKRADTVWCFGVTDKDFAEGSSLSPAVKDVVHSRLPAGSAAWITAAGEKWHEKPLVKLLGKDVIADVAKWNALVAGLEFGAETRLSVAVQTADAAVAEKARAKFRNLAVGERSTSGGEGNWATVSKPVDPADFASELRRIVEVLP